MIYLVFTVISAVFLALYDLLKKISLKDNDIYGVLFFYALVAFICSFVFVREAFLVDFKSVLFILLKSFVISFSWFLTMKAMSKLDLGIVVPFSLLGSVGTTILASIVLKEKIGVEQIGGMLVILLGLFLLSRLCEKGGENRDYRYLLLLVLAAFLSSVCAIIDKFLIDDVGYNGVMFWFFFFLMVIYFILNIIKNKKIKFFNYKKSVWVIGIGVSIFLADLFYYVAISYDNASLSMVSIVRKLSVFIGVVLGCVFLKEKKFLKKLFLLFLMFGGLAGLLFW